MRTPYLTEHQETPKTREVANARVPAPGVMAKTEIYPNFPTNNAPFSPANKRNQRC